MKMLLATVICATFAFGDVAWADFVAPAGAPPIWAQILVGATIAAVLVLPVRDLIGIVAHD